MRDIVLEWYVTHIPDKKELLVRAVLVSAAIVLFADAVLFAAIMLFPAAAAAVAAWLMTRRGKYEYEFVYVNGDFTISRIIRKAKRKDVYHVDRVDIEAFQRGRKETVSRAMDFTSKRAGAPVYSLKARGTWACIEATPEFVEEMSRYYPIQTGGSNG